ncbi:HAD family hydrolase [Polynucleobacter paneuropaeus]|nr:HAD family hydrolase [Polynucleobacter paneuropaeus]
MGLSLNKFSKLPSRSIIFDLDGTLIDSQESILGTMKIILKEYSLEAKIPVDKRLIGPPLIKLISEIIGVQDRHILIEIADKFKLYYDAMGCMDSIAYPGIHNLLKYLHSQGYSLYVATNKRLIPTKKILAHLSWDSLFSAVYTIDLHAEKPFTNKAEMISSLLSNELVDPKSAIYIGDRLEDYQSAKENELHCILVNWGYGDKNSKHDDFQISASDPSELLNAIEGIL